MTLQATHASLLTCLCPLKENVYYHLTSSAFADTGYGRYEKKSEVLVGVHCMKIIPYLAYEKRGEFSIAPWNDILIALFDASASTKVADRQGFWSEQ